MVQLVIVAENSVDYLVLEIDRNRTDFLTNNLQRFPLLRLRALYWPSDDECVKAEAVAVIEEVDWNCFGSELKADLWSKRFVVAVELY